MFARSLPVSIAVHLAALVLVFIVPLAAPVALTLPAPPLPPYVKAAAIPPPPAPPPRVAASHVPSRVPSLAPTVAPMTIRPEVERATAPSAFTDPFGVAGPPIDTGAIGDAATTIDLPSPPPAPRPAGPVRAGELLVAPRKLVDVRPVYPQIARDARIQGTVILEAVLDRKGRVSQVRVVRSSPLLDQAAIDAVSRWQYTPSVLHGQPIEVLMTITVTFKLES